MDTTLTAGPGIPPGLEAYFRMFQKLAGRDPNTVEIEHELTRRQQAPYASVAPINQPAAMREPSLHEQMTPAERRVMIRLNDPELFGPGVTRGDQAQVAAKRYAEGAVGGARGVADFFLTPLHLLSAATEGIFGPPPMTKQQRAEQPFARPTPGPTVGQIVSGLNPLTQAKAMLSEPDAFRFLGGQAGMVGAGELAGLGIGEAMRGPAPAEAPPVDWQRVFTPQLEHSAAAPGIIDARASEIGRRLLDHVSEPAEATYEGLVRRRLERLVPPDYTPRRAADAYTPTERMQVAATIAQNIEGATLVPQGKMPTTEAGFAVADPQFTLQLNPTENLNASIQRWITRMDVQRALREPGAHVGTWRDPETGQAEVNVTGLLPDEAQARRLGEARGEKAIGELGPGGEYLRSIPLSGAFDLLGNERGAMPWGVEPGGRLYSRTQRAVEKAPFEKGTPQQWLAHLERAPGGTFREEVERSGVKQMLENAATPQLDLLHSGPRTFTKDEVLQQLRDNQFGIRETQRGGTTGTRPQFASYKLPGGDNYREIVLSAAQPGEGDPYRGHFNDVDNPIVHLRMTDREIGGQQAAFIEELQSDVHQKGREEGYKDPEAEARARLEEKAANDQHRGLVEHYGRALDSELKVSEASVHNVAVGGPAPGAILRLGGLKIGELVPHPQTGNLYFDGAGGLESWSTHETNMDMARNAVSEFLTDPKRPDRVFATLQELHEQVPPTISTPGGLTHPDMTSSKTIVAYARDAMDRLQAVGRRAEAAGDIVRKASAGVPKLPFSRTEDWSGLGIRRALDEAVQSGKTRLAWTTGEQQNARYNLAKFVDELHYDPTEKKLYAFKNGSKVVNESDVTPEKLPSYVGQDVADRLLRQPLKESGYYNQPRHVLTGEAMNVGGSGMRSYYDQMLPKMVKEQFRKLGSKVEPALTEKAAVPQVEEWTDRSIHDLAREHDNPVLEEMYQRLPEGVVDPDDFESLLDDAEEKVRDEKSDELAQEWEPEKFDPDEHRSDAENYIDETYAGPFSDLLNGLPRGAELSAEEFDALGEGLRHEASDFFDAVKRHLERHSEEPYTKSDIRSAYEDVYGDYVGGELESIEEMWHDEHKNDEPPYDDFSEQASEYASQHRRDAESLLRDAPEGSGPPQVWYVDIPPELAARVQDKGLPLGAMQGGMMALTGAIAAGGVTAAALMQGKQNPETTQLAPKDEPRFRAWVKRYNIHDLDHPDSHYDYRGAFLAGAKPDAKGHWPDTFKQHGHESFSVQSKYSRGPQDGGRWQGNTYIPQTNAKKDSLARKDRLAKKIRGY